MLECGFSVLQLAESPRPGTSGKYRWVKNKSTRRAAGHSRENRERGFRSLAKGIAKPLFFGYGVLCSIQRSRPGNRRKWLNGETGSPASSSQREDGEPEESVRGPSRSDFPDKQVVSSI